MSSKTTPGLLLTTGMMMVQDLHNNHMLKIPLYFPFPCTDNCGIVGSIVNSIVNSRLRLCLNLQALPPAYWHLWSLPEPLPHSPCISLWPDSRWKWPSCCTTVKGITPGTVVLAAQVCNRIWTLDGYPKHLPLSRFHCTQLDLSMSKPDHAISCKYCKIYV